MRYLLAVLAVIAALVVAQGVTAQEALDLGEPTPLLIACHMLTEVVEDDGLIVKNCRRAAPDEITGWRAKIHVRLMTDLGPIEAEVRLYKSLWTVTTAIAEDG